jgi:hypothetical protein
MPAPQEAVVEAVVEDLAVRLGIPADGVTIAAVEPTDWPDSSLGCPQPGEMYAQVVTPGLRIELQAQGDTYVVHTDLESQWVICSPGFAPALPTLPVIPGEIDDGQPWMPAG